MIAHDPELTLRVATDLVMPVVRAVLKGDTLEGIREYQEARAPHRMRYSALMASGAEYNVVTDGPYGWPVTWLERSLRDALEQVAELRTGQR